MEEEFAKNTAFLLKKKTIEENKCGEKLGQRCPKPSHFLAHPSVSRHAVAKPMSNPFTIQVIPLIEGSLGTAHPDQDAKQTILV